MTKLDVRPSIALRVAAWASFVAETTIIATGGAVRLTGSGLGCPSWPTCTPESLIPTDDLTYHSLIEFGNRLMTGVVGIVAVVVVLLVWRMRRSRRDLWILSLVVLGGVVAQALVGGITVWTGLNPFIVGFHYVASLLLVCVTAAFLTRLYDRPGPRVRAVPDWYATLAVATAVVMAVSIAFGVLTTGAGPHSGDSETLLRNGFDAGLFEHVHAWPGYALLALTLVLLIPAFTMRLATRKWALALLIIELVQVAVGLYQARNGLPVIAVGAHMVLAALTAAAMTVLLLRMRTSTVALSAAPTRETAQVLR